MKPRRQSFLTKKDVSDMLKWRYEYADALRSTEAAYQDLLSILDVNERGYSGKLIKIGITIFFIPILGISEVIGAILIGMGLFLKAFSRKSYPISRIGRDLRFSLDYLKSYYDSIKLLE